VTTLAVLTVTTIVVALGVAAATRSPTPVSPAAHWPRAGTRSANELQGQIDE
jgi:hypothetical protein